MESRMEWSSNQTREPTTAKRENVRNENSQRVIEFCIENDLMKVTIKFPHKQIHTFMREEPTKNDRFLSDKCTIN